MCLPLPFKKCCNKIYFCQYATASNLSSSRSNRMPFLVSFENFFFPRLHWERLKSKYILQSFPTNRALMDCANIILHEKILFLLHTLCSVTLFIFIYFEGQNLSKKYGKISFLKKRLLNIMLFSS